MFLAGGFKEDQNMTTHAYCIKENGAFLGCIKEPLHTYLYGSICILRLLWKSYGKQAGESISSWVLSACENSNHHARTVCQSLCPPIVI